MMEIIYIIMNMEILFTVERGRLLVNDYGSTCRNLLIDRKKIEIDFGLFFPDPCASLLHRKCYSIHTSLTFRFSQSLVS